MFTQQVVETRVYPPYLPEDREAVAAFLRARGLDWEEGLEVTVALYRGSEIVGTGSLSGRVIKCLAVEDSLRGEGLATIMVSRLEHEAAAKGFAHPMVFTLPDNRGIFQAMGYHEIESVAGAVVLLEKGDGLSRWTRALSESSARLPEGDGPTAAMVMNCNPFTLGHLHLIRTAAAASSRVFVILVGEDASVFPAEVRLRLVQAETASMPNVVVIPGTEYLVSRATFPSYFLKKCPCSHAWIHARLDARIFGHHIAPALGVARRYLGEEPLCPVTALYNRALQAELPAFGLEVVEIPRLLKCGAPISASQVRQCLALGDLQGAKALVPPATAAFFESPDAAPILARVKASTNRH